MWREEDLARSTSGRGWREEVRSSELGVLSSELRIMDYRREMEATSRKKG